MKSRTLNLLIEGMAVFVFSLWFSLLLEPWLYAANELLEFTAVPYYRYVWLIIVIISGITVQKFIPGLNFTYSMELMLFGLLVVNILIIWFLDWPLLVFIPLLFVVLLYSFRYGLLRSGTSFIFDFICGTAFMMFTVFLDYYLNLFVNPLYSLVFYFVASIFLFFILNLRYTEIHKYIIRPGMLSGVLFLFIVSVLFLGVLGGVIAGEQFYITVFNYISWGIRWIVFGVLLLFYPVIWLLSPFIEYVSQLTYDIVERISETTLGEQLQQQMEEIEENGEAFTELWTYLNYFLVGLLFIFGCLLLYIILKKIVEKIKKYMEEKSGEEEPGYEEERESIFSAAEFKKSMGGLKRLFNSWLSKNKDSGPEYGNNPEGVIREIYYKLLKKYSKIAILKKHNTPLEYMSKLQKKLKNHQLFLEITELYNKARYSSRVDKEDAVRAQKIWESIKNISSGNDERE